MKWIQTWVWLIWLRRKWEEGVRKSPMQSWSHYEAAKEAWAGQNRGRRFLTVLLLFLSLRDTVEDLSFDTLTSSSGSRKEPITYSLLSLVMKRPIVPSQKRWILLWGFVVTLSVLWLCALVCGAFCLLFVFSSDGTNDQVLRMAEPPYGLNHSSHLAGASDQLSDWRQRKSMLCCHSGNSPRLPVLAGQQPSRLEPSCWGKDRQTGRERQQKSHRTHSQRSLKGHTFSECFWD